MHPPSPDTAEFGAGLALSDFTQLGWDQHDKQPAALAAALRQRMPTLPADADGAAAIGLAEHLALAHLHDTSALAALLDSLPAELGVHADTAAAVAKARWAQAVTADHEPPPGLADAPRWRALQNVWTHRVAQGRATEAAAQLTHEVAAALAHPEPAARRALAATCNNLALGLREGPRGDPTVDALMLGAASASRDIWAGVGTWVHVERADYQLARCHAALGHGDEARAFGQAVLDALQAQADSPEADDFEWFFGHEAMAWACRTAGDAGAAAEQRALMQARCPKVADAELRDWCEQALAAYDGAS